MKRPGSWDCIRTNIIFSPKGFDEYTSWLKDDQKTQEKINKLILDIVRKGVLEGSGNPERLRYKDEEIYSRRINQKDRLVYTMTELGLFIISCKGHYEEY